MNTIDRLLKAYPALSLGERVRADAQFDALGAEREAYADAIADAHRLADLADALDASFGPPDPETLARLTVAEHLRVPGASDALAAARADDPELDALADALAARLLALTAAAEGPAARFERLTGRRLGTRPSALGGDSLAAEPRMLLGASDRGPARRRRVRLTRWAAVAMAVVVAYGGLFAVSASMVPERAQVAALTEIEPLDAPALRGAGETPAARAAGALAAVGEARRSTLGLFPRYDAAALARAAEALEAVARDADPSSSASQEARLAIGRIYVHQGRDAEAARVLGALVAEGRYRAPEARRLLDYLRAQE